MLSNKYFFIADTHFHHNAIIKYENRPFADLNKMNEILIKNWNKTLKNGNVVFLLGDYAFCNKIKMQEICEKLNGTKVLIIGNHDEKSPKFYREIGFDEVSKYPIIFEKNWILSHEPISLEPGSSFKNIYGHVHTDPAFQDYTDNSFCVSVERIDYKPIEFQMIQKKMNRFKKSPY